MKIDLVLLNGGCRTTKLCSLLVELTNLLDGVSFHAQLKHNECRA
uniref:Uncharacterized protein n=1 Tax=Rhizophora mucronata TaxID=61149 RepID=A0A2P2IZJ9_RHIMU